MPKIIRLPTTAGNTKLINQTLKVVRLIPKLFELKIPINFILSSFFIPTSVKRAIVGMAAITKNMTLIPNQHSTTETSTPKNLKSKKYCKLKTTNLSTDIDKNRTNKVAFTCSTASTAQANLLVLAIY